MNIQSFKVKTHEMSMENMTSMHHCDTKQLKFFIKINDSTDRVRSELRNRFRFPFNLIVVWSEKIHSFFFWSVVH